MLYEGEVRGSKGKAEKSIIREKQLNKQ